MKGLLKQGWQDKSGQRLLAQEIVEQLEAALKFRGVEEVLAANGK